MMAPHFQGLLHKKGQQGLISRLFWQNSAQSKTHPPHTLTIYYEICNNENAGTLADRFTSPSRLLPLPHRQFPVFFSPINISSISVQPASQPRFHVTLVHFLDSSSMKLQRDCGLGVIKHIKPLIRVPNQYYVTS